MGKLLGDFIADTLTAVGIKKCGGCSRRQKALNDAHQKAKDAIKPKRGRR